MFHFILWLAPFFHYPAHPIHVSVSEVECVAGKVDWTIRIFKDDLLLALYGKNVSMQRLEDLENIKEDIRRYVSGHIHVTANAKMLSWKLSAIHPDPEAIWITLQADLPDQNTGFWKIDNDVLMDVYHDQKNIVNFNCGAATKSLIFEKGDKEKSVSF